MVSGDATDRVAFLPRVREENNRNHDFTDRIFAILITEDGFEEITVEYRHFCYRTCQQTISADLSKLFYNEFLFGKPIVTLCLQLAAKMSPTEVEEHLQQGGIQVEKDTVRRYVKLFGEILADQPGITVAEESLVQNVLATLFDVETVEELNEEYADELTETGSDEIADCVDEMYSVNKDVKKELYEEHLERKQEGMEPRRIRTVSRSGAGISRSWTVTHGSNAGRQRSQGRLRTR